MSRNESYIVPEFHDEPTAVMQGSIPRVNLSGSAHLVLSAHPEPWTYLRTLADRASTLADECERVAVRSS